MLGVTKVLVVAKAVPPVATLYQTVLLPEVDVAESVTVPTSQRLPAVDEVIVGVGVAVATTAVLGEVQVAVAAST